MSLQYTPKKSKAKKPSRRKARQSDGGDDEEEGDEEESKSKSVIKRKYRMRYRPHKMTCGDALAQQIRAEFMTEKDEDTGKPRMNMARFIKFAIKNACWDGAYGTLANTEKGYRLNLNPGMVRMNVINRLRARIRRKEEVRW